jgi:hypothetical protein
MQYQEHASFKCQFSKQRQNLKKGNLPVALKETNSQVSS